jgi:transcriptional regulator with XRE-family HTH domain
MKRARVAAGLTQETLAKKIHCTQPMIAGIERGSIRSSTLILAICDTLSIPPPHVLVGDELDERWIEVGRLLRAKMPALFDGQLAGIESMVEALKKNQNQ